MVDGYRTDWRWWDCIDGVWDVYLGEEMYDMDQAIS